MEGRRAVGRREEKKPTGTEAEVGEGGLKWPRGSEREEGLEREQ
jgi:hypothetical protein